VQWHYNFGCKILLYNFEIFVQSFQNFGPRRYKLFQLDSTLFHPFTFCVHSQRLVMDVLMRGGDEAFEEGVRLVGLAQEFRVELAGDEKWVIL
jgi:hypothetical protein